VLLSDGADNAAASVRIRWPPPQAAHPGSHHRLGREHPDRDVEITDAVLPARALPQSRLTATVTFSSYGFSGSRARLSVRDNGKVWPAGRDARFRRPAADESLVFNCGDAGSKTFSIGIDRCPAKRTCATSGHPPGQRGGAQAAHPIRGGEPRWDYKFIRRALPSSQ